MLRVSECNGQGGWLLCVLKGFLGVYGLRLGSLAELYFGSGRRIGIDHALELLVGSPDGILLVVLYASIFYIYFIKFYFILIYILLNIFIIIIILIYIIKYI